jgi:hypothetical protein
MVNADTAHVSLPLQIPYLHEIMQEPIVVTALSLHILKLIRANEAGWEELVPEKVAEVIKRKKLFR